jgi:hypothetical protein
MVVCGEVHLHLASCTGRDRTFRFSDRLFGGQRLCSVFFWNGAPQSHSLRDVAQPLEAFCRSLSETVDDVERVDYFPPVAHLDPAGPVVLRVTRVAQWEGQPDDELVLDALANVLGDRPTITYVDQ